MLTVYLIILILGLLIANFPVATIVVFKSVIPIFSAFDVTVFKPEGVSEKQKKILEESGIILGVRIFGIILTVIGIYLFVRTILGI
jgi:hypothetical protein